LRHCWRLAVRHDRLGRRAGRPADAAASGGLDRGGGCAGVGGGLGGVPMTRRTDDTPEVIFLALWFCGVLAIGSWVWEVLTW
jgi:hypothetical protein